MENVLYFIVLAMIVIEKKKNNFVESYDLWVWLFETFSDGWRR